VPGVNNVYLKALLSTLKRLQGFILAGQESGVEKMPCPLLDSGFNYFPRSMQVDKDKIGSLRAKKLAVASLESRTTYDQRVSPVACKF